MPLKIICLEEHLADPDLAQAVKAAPTDAPYQADLGSEYREAPDDGPRDRPRIVDPIRANELASAPIEQRLADMDACEIDVQVLSSTLPVQALPVREGVELARRCNNRVAEIAARHPNRFAGFSTLPWQDPDAAARELERSVEELGLTATLLAGRPGRDVMVDDARFHPVLERMAELGVPLYIHPGPPLQAVQQAYFAGFDKEVTARLSLYGWGWHNEAGIQVIRLILSGLLDRLPGLQLISGHWGEMVPFFLQRMDDAMPSQVTGLQRSIGRTYRDQVYVTPSGMLNLPHFRFIHEALGAERIMFSVDYPYLTMTGARAWLESLPVTDSERDAIANGNAERLLGLAV